MGWFRELKLFGSQPVDNDPILPYVYIITGGCVFCTSPRDILRAGAPATSRVQKRAPQRALQISRANRWRAPPKKASRGPL